MKKFLCMVIALFCLVSAGQTVRAAAREWELDKAHSNFYFRISHIYSKVDGKFNDFSGEIQFDPANLAESRFVFEIKTDSVNTDIAKRDKHLQSTDFFDSEHFPLMTFVSTKITDAGNNVYEVAGQFTVKGVAYDLTLPLTLAGIKDHPAVKGKEVIGFNGELTIDRLAYHIGTGKFYQMGLVGKDVEILVTLEALSDKK